MPWTQPRAREAMIRRLYEDPETTNIPVLMGTERPPPDAYDKYQGLVPPHFAATPALTNIDKAYTKYGNKYQKEKWRPVSIEAKASAQRLYRKHGLNYNMRFKCGLYIVGSERDMQDKNRDRMMVLVFELSEYQLSLWRRLHADAVKLLDQLELSGEPGVCIRYYHRVEWSGMRDATQASHTTRPIAGSSSYDILAELGAQGYDQFETPQERSQRESQSRIEGNQNANNRPMSLYRAAQAFASSVIPIPSSEEANSSVRTANGLDAAVDNAATTSAERSTTPTRPTTSGRSLHDVVPSAYRPDTIVQDTYSRIFGPDYSTSDFLNQMPPPNPFFSSNFGIAGPYDGESYDDHDGATDVSVLSIAGSDKEEEPLLPRFPEPAFEFRRAFEKNALVQETVALEPVIHREIRATRTIKVCD